MNPEVKQKKSSKFNFEARFLAVVILIFTIDSFILFKTGLMPETKTQILVVMFVVLMLVGLALAKKVSKEEVSAK